MEQEALQATAQPAAMEQEGSVPASTQVQAASCAHQDVISSFPAESYHAEIAEDILMEQRLYFADDNAESRLIKPSTPTISSSLPVLHSGLSPNPVDNTSASCATASSTCPPAVCDNAPKPPPHFSVNPAWQKKPYVDISQLNMPSSSYLQCGVVTLDDAAVKRMETKFANALVGRLFGRRLPYPFLTSELHKRWGHFEGFRLLDVGQDCFVCLFAHEADRDAILRSGPWIVAGQVLGLDVWTPKFTASSAVGSSTPLWIRLPGLPLYSWDVLNLARITSALGTPLWVDPCTATVDRVAYARVCVRIDLSLPLKSGIWIDSCHGKFYQKVEYEGLSVICFNCGIVGHKEATCPTKTSQPAAGPNPTAAVPNSSSLQPSTDVPAQSNCPSTSASQHVPPAPTVLHSPSTPTTSDSAFGPWMLVMNRRRRPQTSRSTNPSQPPVGQQFIGMKNGKNVDHSQFHTNNNIFKAKNPFAVSENAEFKATTKTLLSKGKPSKLSSKSTKHTVLQKQQLSNSIQPISAPVLDESTRPKRLRSVSPSSPPRLTPHD
ncbi:Uncharacterized protein AXF42_Ash021356 [Apostasia shenzhenica]|uniref:CCHC-type domain-containing protein n=1 Tax=Apostasia shenzhenica TaxID=1088818 RepID=A0A2H9ZSN8_9ASPA|nr:Uncharacterized protein AXF42_Ash021356 [Apostasia shenzhenica]